MITEKIPKISSINNSRIYLNAMVYSLNRAMSGKELNQFDIQKLEDLLDLLSRIENINNSTDNGRNLASTLSHGAKNYEFYNLKKLITKSYTFKSWENQIADNNNKLNLFLKSTKEIINNSISNKKSSGYDANIINNIFYDIIARY